MYHIADEEEIKKVKEIIGFMSIGIVLCIFGLGLSTQWIVNSEHDLSKKENLSFFESTILQIEKNPLIVYSEEVLWSIKLKNGKNILITESQMEYVTENEILNMKEGNSISYRISSTDNNIKNIEAEELYYEEMEIYTLADYNANIKANRKSAFLIFPISIVGIIIFSADLYRSIKMLKVIQSECICGNEDMKDKR